MSEDCLTLNIWAPPNARKDAPVFVWIHGGSLAQRRQPARPCTTARRWRGAASSSCRSTTGWACSAIWRIPASARNRRDGVSGNYGLLDQIAALRWVKRNIARLRRRPGERHRSPASPPGGLSVMYLMAAPQARGLFAQGDHAKRLHGLRAGAAGAPRYGGRPPEAIGAVAAGQQLGAAGPRRACARWTRATLTARRRARPAISRSAPSTAAVLPRPARRHLRSRRAGAGAGAGGVQQRRDPLAARPAAAAARRCGRPMRRRSASATAISPTTSCASIPPSNLAESMLAAAARRALRLDRRAARARSRPPPAQRGVPLLLRPRLSRRRCARPARLPRQRNPVRVRHRRPHAAALARDARHGGRERALRRDARATGSRFARDRRAERGRAAGVARLRRRRAPTWPSTARRGPARI